jgi:glutamate dehydrogenase
MLEPVLMAHTALNHWDMSVKRKPGAPAVRICIIPGDAENPGLNRTVIDIVYDDMAFLVDSVAAEIGRHKRLIRLLLHPILQAKMGKNRKLAAITADAEGGSLPQSHMHIQLHGALAQAQMAEMEADLRDVLVNVGHATRDWMKIREKLRAAQSDLGGAPKSHGDSNLQEYAAFIDYLYRDNFTLLVYC